MLAELSLEVLEIILEFLGISQSRDEPRHHLAPGDDHEDRANKDVLLEGKRNEAEKKDPPSGCAIITLLQNIA